MYMFFTIKIVQSSVLYDSTKAPCLRKIQFFSYCLKCSQPIRLQYSSIMNVFGRNKSISQIFLHGNNHQGKVACETTSWFYVVSWACHPIRFQDSQIINIFVKKLVVFFFLHRDKSSGESSAGDYHFFVGCGLLCLIPNHIEGYL